MLSNSSPITELLKSCSVILLILAIGVEETATSKDICVYILLYVLLLKYVRCILLS